MNKIVFITIAILAIFVMTTTTATNVKASNALSDGYNAGRNDRLDGKPFNDYCDPINSDSVCSAYKVSYAAGWAAASLLHGNEEPRSDQDFTDRTGGDDNNN